MMEVDHIVLRKAGGTNALVHLQLLCGPCNRAKGAGTDWRPRAPVSPRSRSSWPS